MAIWLRPFVIGVPHRIGALNAALAYIVRHEGVWRATGEVASGRAVLRVGRVGHE